MLYVRITNSKSQVIDNQFLIFCLLYMTVVFEDMSTLPTVGTYMPYNIQSKHGEKNPYKHFYCVV